VNDEGGRRCGSHLRFDRQTATGGSRRRGAQQIAGRVRVRELTVHRDDRIQQRDEVRTGAGGIDRSTGLAFRGVRERGLGGAGGGGGGGPPRPSPPPGGGDWGRPRPRAPAIAPAELRAALLATAPDGRIRRADT